MEENLPLRELSIPKIGYVPTSLDFGRDEIFSDIEDEKLILPAAGLAVATLAHCLSKDDDWVSRNEVLRVVIPGDPELKLAAARALCDVGLWAEQERGGKPGWAIGMSEALKDKRERYEHASNAARARYRKAREKKSATNLTSAEDPFA